MNRWSARFLCLWLSAITLPALAQGDKRLL
jgi:hypothetical protein